MVSRHGASSLKEEFGSPDLSRARRSEVGEAIGSVEQGNGIPPPIFVCCVHSSCNG